VLNIPFQYSNFRYPLTCREVRLQVLTAASMKMTAFWDIARCSLVKVDRRFRHAYCLHQNDDGGSTPLCYVGILLRDYIALYTRWLRDVFRLYHQDDYAGSKHIRNVGYSFRLVTSTKRRPREKLTVSLMYSIHVSPFIKRRFTNVFTTATVYTLSQMNPASYIWGTASEITKTANIFNFTRSCTSAFISCARKDATVLSYLYRYI
jgi:hypothetical protein